MHCKLKVLWFCLVNHPDWFIILLPIFHVLLADYYYYFNVEPRCVSGDIFVYLWAPTQGHSKWGMILLPLSRHRGFSRVLVTLPTCLEQPLHHSTDPNPRRRTACPRFRSAARRALAGM